MSSETFYRDLPARESFASFSDLAAYAPLPDDWTMLASDVIGSTQAIQAGRYKQVNMAGAATIMAVLNASGDVDPPYVFGGDGALVAVPDAAAAAARDALARTAGLSRDVYGLDLRVAAFPVAELRRRGGEILVQKLALGQSARLAMFAGPGVALVDALLKDDAEGAPYRLAPGDDPPDLEGLSCRWEPLKASRGVMASLMAASVEPGADAGRALAGVRRRIQSILGGDEAAAAPVSDATLRFKLPPAGLKLEALALAGRRRFWTTYLPLLLQAFAQGYAEKFGKKVGPYDAPVYRQELIAQTDFRKFDGVLRMVLDVTPAAADALEAMLAEERRAGRIAYGLHRADSALMTCLVFDLAVADHVHFVDGADGGITIAAKRLKAQLAERTPTA